MDMFLGDCAEIEENVARIYRLMAKNEAISDDLRAVLCKMASDEDKHAEKIRFALRLQREALFDRYLLPRQRVKELLEETDAILARLRSRSFGEQEAILTMIRLERDFCQVHVEAIAHFKDPQMLKLFEALAGDDASHRATLDAYLVEVN
ncbi:MAG: hypothetical protein C0624_04280 [Desulfuromonas sp.]|nr:MAG: hypothetical protein C0624_04280 [Desulfuromonas sp.]